jgi:hypothetical protein
MGIKLSKKGWMVLSTLIIIGLGFAFYFLVYVKQRESEIIAEKMRVLTQVKENIGLLISSEERVVKNQRSSLEQDVVGIDTTSLMTVLKISYPGWTFDTTNIGEGFHFKNDSATWAVNKMLYKKSYADFFGKDLILRDDRFESIGVLLLKGESVTTLFTNHPSGNISFGDSTASVLNKSIFEWNSSNDRYTVFTSFLDGQDENQIYVLGFVKQSELNKQKQEVSVFIITAAIILVTLMILGLPLLKLQVMSSTERLGAKDVFLAGACMVVGPPVVILFFLLITTNIFADKRVEKDQLAQLNDKIIIDFKKELKNAIQQLSDVKATISSDFVAADIATLKEQPFFNQFAQNPNSYFTTTTAQRDSLFKSFGYFNSIFWTDRLGHIAIYLSSEKNPRLISSLSHRNYVMDLIRGRGILFEKDTIAFESIRSVTDGNYELGLGIASENKAFPILATSFSSVSLMDPVLEEGYGFCLFNAEGRTLFHSEIQRNLNENFLEETSEVFNPYVRSGVPYATSTRYMGEEHYMYMQKVPGLDGYFLATFLDKAYTYSPNAIALNTTAEMQMAYLTLLFLAYLPLFAVVCKKKKLKQKIFILYWLRPLLYGEKNSTYYDLLVINTISFVYLAVSVIVYQYCIYAPELLILSIVKSGFFLVVTNFFLLSRSFPKSELTHTHYYEGGNLKPFWTVVTIYISVLTIIKLMVIQDNFHPLKAWDLIVFIIILWAYYSSQRPLNFITAKHILRKMNLAGKSENEKSDQYLSYKLYCTSLILLISVIPTFIFFSITYRTEQEILFKQKSMTLKERKDKWSDLKSAQFLREQQGVFGSTVDSLEGFIGEMGSTGLQNHYSSGSFHFSGTLVDAPIFRDTDNYSNWYNDARVEFDDYGTNSRGFISDGDTNNWSFKGKGMNFHASDPPQSLTASIGSFQNLFIQNWWAMIIFPALLVVIIYVLLDSVIAKIFGLYFKHYDTMIRPRDYHKIGGKLIQIYRGADVLKDSFNNSFIVGVNATHVYKIYHQLKNWKKEEFYSIELLDLPNLIEEFEKKDAEDELKYFSSGQLKFQIPILRLVRHPHDNYVPLLQALQNKHIRMEQPPLMVFIEHFEYAYDNEALNKVKLNLLQRLVSNPSIRVVISSEISPTKIFEFYEEHIKKATALGSHSLENIEKANELKSTFKQWQHLLGGFYRITVPFDLNESLAMPQELKHGQYLNRINSKYKVLYSGFKNDDNHILNVQETSYTYYFAIWNSLTKEERYIIYDIAHDQFINTNNVDGIIDLLHKGILIYDYSLHLMNESFTNFVLTKVDGDEALEQELESNKKGNWSTASAVLILVIISLIVFISLGNINILQDVNALLASLTAIFAVFLRLGGMFVTGKAKE